MNHRPRLAALLVLLLVVGTAKLGAELYRWYAFAEERAVLSALGEELLDAGVEIIQLHMRADTLRTRVETDDEHLDRDRREIEAYARYAPGGSLPAHLYASYRQSLRGYNDRVQSRNGNASEWREVVTLQNAAVRRYNELADSIRKVAEGIGEPYYPIPLPVEAAIRRGVLPAVD